MLYDDLLQFEIQSDSLCLNLADYPEVGKLLKQGEFILVSFDLPYQNGREFGIKFVDAPNWRYPFDFKNCKLPNATSALAFAMFVEYNKGFFKTSVATLYQMATQLSDNPIYATIYERYLERVKR